MTNKHRIAGVLAVLLALGTAIPAQGEPAFLRTTGALDEARGYCIDIRGQGANLRPEASLQGHTCKVNNWVDMLLDDGLDRISAGPLIMPEYNQSELVRRGIKIAWQLPAGTRSEALDRETLEAIYDAGCKFIVYAPESGSEDTLRSIKKRLSLDKLKQSVRDAVAVGHTVKINFIIGFPDETRKQMLQTV